jgi:hypothetical protein
VTVQRLSNRLTAIILFILLIGFFAVPKAHADISNLSDTISTSRPSAAAPLSAAINVNDGQAQIVDNGSIFLSSDSARINFYNGGLGMTTEFGKNIASMSASGIPSTGNRLVYLGGPCAGAGCFGSAHHIGIDALIDNVTATHTISFNSSASIPVGGKIMITFPSLGGIGSNIASPSATTFSFNGLAPAGVTFGGTGSSCGTAQITVSAPIIYCTVATAPVNAGTITIIIGSTPTLINPTKTAAAGTADLWKLQIDTTNGTTSIDSARATIGTVESVQVQATVDPTLTFTITPKQATDLSPEVWNNHGNCTTDADIANSGIGSTSTNINLGLLNTSAINTAYQLITISTNGLHGYTLTATSSGHLMDPSSGFWITDSTTPVAISSGQPWFGVHACGLNVNGGTWGSGTAGSGALFAWPTSSTPITLSSAGTGPIGNSGSTGGAGSGLTAVEYAATVDVSVPAGNYVSTITYTATPTF